MFCLDVGTPLVESSIHVISISASTTYSAPTSSGRKYKQCLKCSTRPSFNFEGFPAHYCAKHKEIGMVDVVNKRCKKCSSQPTHNFEGLKAQFCAKHSEHGMFNVVTKKCLKCSTLPSYNFEGLKAQYCVVHKELGMVDVISIRCVKCSKQPSYNFEGLPPLYCVTHTAIGMVDVRSVKCAKCLKQPAYNFKGLPPLYCLTHVEVGMIDVINKRCLKCMIRPNYNYNGLSEGIYCYIHKEPDMVNVLGKRCLTTTCSTFATNSNYDGYCLRCFMLNPENEGKQFYRNQNTKERNVANCIQSLFPEFNWRMDKRIVGGQSKRRPDIFVDMESYVIIVEIDEYQHTRHPSYDKNHESARLMEIWADIKRRNIILIRFNPDSYITREGIKIPSCWGVAKGIAHVPDKKKPQWQIRIDALTQQIQYWMKTIPDKSIETIELFYS
jgi:hypothetical protein